MKKFLLLVTLIIVASTQINAQYNTELLGKKTYTGQNLSGSWGWNDTINNKEYALVGTTKGLSIVDITTPSNPVEVKFINGKQGTWRECQTYGHYAYITQDNDTTKSEGILIYDLSLIPNGKADTFKGTTPNDYISRTHSLYIDEKGFLYLNGGDGRVNGTRTNGVMIYDLKPNPMKPTYVGFTQNLFGTGAVNYVHDCYVRNDTMYQAHIYNNRFTVWDVRDRSNPVKIQDFATPYSTIHNMWLSDNSKTLFVSHEQFTYPAEAYDISDLSNIRQLCEFKVSPNNQEILHNVHVLNDFIIASYYSDGVAIFDASDPSNLVCVGYYDTQPTSTKTENGVWGAFGFYKSGVITLSDMIKGLHVIKPTYVRAARIQGVVTDTNTTQILAGVKISFADTTMNTALTSVDGFYKLGTPKPGLTRFKAEKTGYVTKYFFATLVNGSTVTVDVQLRQTPIEVKISAAFCENKSYTLPNGSKVSEPGVYYTNYVLPSGKDSIIKTTLTELPASYTSKTVHLCDGDSYQLPDGSFTSAEGTYYDTLQNSISCDSVITTSVFKHPEYAIFKTDSFNLGSTYTLPNGTTTTTGGTFVSNLLTAVYGCDSVITIDLKTISVTGIRNNSGEIQLKFVVNNNTLQLISKANIQLKELRLYNALGEMVIAYVNPERLLYLPVLPKGIYIIRATTTDNEEYTGKISPF